MYKFNLQTSRKLEREQQCHLSAIASNNEVQHCEHGGENEDEDEDEDEVGDGDGDRENYDDDDDDEDEADICKATIGYNEKSYNRI